MSIHSFIHPFICLSIHPSIYMSIHSFIHPFICLSIHSSIYMSIHSFIHPFICLSIHSSIHLCVYHLFIHPFICLSIHSSIHLFVYPSIHPSIYMSIIHSYRNVTHLSISCVTFPTLFGSGVGQVEVIIDDFNVTSSNVTFDYRTNPSCMSLVPNKIIPA